MTSTGSGVGSPGAIFRLANSFCDAKALLSAVELGLFTALRQHPCTREEIADALGLHGRGVADWLELLVALGLLERHGERYRNAPGADRHLVRGEREYIGGFLERSNHLLFPAWESLTEALRTGKPQSTGDFRDMINDPTALARFTDMMDALTGVLAPQLIEAYDRWHRYRSILDIGGCRGYLAARIVASHPHLTGHVADLPQLSPLFDALVTEHGLADRLTFHPGDFFTDPLPTADVVVFGHALHDWNDRQREFLLRKAFSSVRPGGDLLVYDRMLDDQDGVAGDHARVENLVVSLDMLLTTEGGREYSVGELREHAEAAGFEWVDSRPLGDYDTLAVCHRPA